METNNKKRRLIRAIFDYILLSVLEEKQVLMEQ